jgi:hypothetical protein
MAEKHVPFAESPLDAFRGAGPRPAPETSAPAPPPSPAPEAPAKKRPGRRKKHQPDGTIRVTYYEKPITLFFD